MGLLFGVAVVFGGGGVYVWSEARSAMHEITGAVLLVGAIVALVGAFTIPWLRSISQAVRRIDRLGDQWLQTQADDVRRRVKGDD